MSPQSTDLSESAATDPAAILARSIPNGRVHSGYLLTGGAGTTRTAALAFMRALACEAQTGETCEHCPSCRRSASATTGEAPIALDGDGKRAPSYRHVGDHAGLFWVERGRDATRIKVEQIRELQIALRLKGFGDGRRVALVEGAEWMNATAQNALLRTLEEPPPRTTFVLTTVRASSVLATIRSRCVRVRFAPEPELDPRAVDAPPAAAEIVALLDGLRTKSVPELLDAAESYRGARADAAEAVTLLIDVGFAWLRERVIGRVSRGEAVPVRELDAEKSLLALRRDLRERNANPQMVAERLLFGLRDATA